METTLAVRTGRESVLLFVTGLSVGWIVGLSTSEVTRIILASLITLVVSSVATISHLELAGVRISGRLSATPFALLTCAIAIGATGEYWSPLSTSKWLNSWPPDPPCREEVLMGDRKAPTPPPSPPPRTEHRGVTSTTPPVKPPPPPPPPPKR